MACEITLKNVPFHLSTLHSAGCAVTPVWCGVVWCTGLGWILITGSELVIRGFSSGAEVGRRAGICFKMLCVKLAALY